MVYFRKNGKCFANLTFNSWEEMKNDASMLAYMHGDFVTTIQGKGTNRG
jgi:hypothetical protein